MAQITIIGFETNPARSCAVRHLTCPTALIAVAFVAVLPPALTAQETPVEIELASGTPAEIEARDQLLRLLAEHDVERWIVTRRVLIEERVIPHSHPVLTMSTGNADLYQLSTFLHEQFHWWVNERAEARDAAKADFAELFPEAPGREGQGARNRESTWLHLIVSDLEYQAMTELYGEEVARELMAGITHYEWIYDKVLNDPRVREINRKHGLIVP